MIALADGLQRFRACVADASRREPAVSAWSIGMHVHHCCLAMTGISRVLIASTPPAPPPKRSLLVWLVFLTGRIPRGRGRAPETVLPKENVGEAELLASLDEAERLLDEAQRMDRSAWFKHFVFGPLDRDRTLRFIRMHNDHHLRIIDDIRRA